MLGGRRGPSLAVESVAWLDLNLGSSSKSDKYSLQALRKVGTRRLIGVLEGPSPQGLDAPQPVPSNFRGQTGSSLQHAHSLIVEILVLNPPSHLWSNHQVKPG